MNRLAVITCLLSVVLTGCGAMPTPAVNSQPNPNLKHPSATLADMPYVLIIGDSTVSSWMTPAVTHEHTLWTAAGTPSRSGDPWPTEYSGDVATRLPARLAAQHYDVVVILAGIDDIQAPSTLFADGGLWSGPCGGGNSTNPAVETCQSLLTMMGEAHAAGAKVILCQIPKTEAYAQQYNDHLAASEDSFNSNLTAIIGLGTPVWNPDAVLVLPALQPGSTGPTYDPAWTDDGYRFSDEGAQRAADSLEAALRKLGRWGVK